MPFFIRIEDAAKSLSTTTEDLREFEQRGWISFTIFEEAQITYLRGHQQYRAKFIMTLRDRLNLDRAQIAKVLANQEPPYSLADVPDILRMPDTP